MNQKLVRLIFSGILFATGFIVPDNPWYISFIIFLLSYIVIGYDIVFKAIRNLFNGNFLDENFLMSLATIGAMAIGEYPEAAAVMLFYQVGELFQGYAVGKSRKSIAALMNIRPDYANLVNGDTFEIVDPDHVNIGDVILVKPGEKIPLDGIIIDGYSSIDASSLTGESVPREVQIESEVISGCINLNGLLKVKVTKVFSESTVSKILELVENAASRKSNTEHFITKFFKVYTPIIVLLAILVAILPPLLIQNQTFEVWFYRALSFLVVSCPCALVISIPLSFFGGIGGASRNGILVKGANYLEALRKVKIVVFDKTGTLTKGVFEVQKVHAIGIEEKELLRIVTYAEYASNHPISLSLKKAYSKEIDTTKISNTEEIPGQGIKAVVEKKHIYAGNNRLMKNLDITTQGDDEVGTVIHVVIDSVYKGYILIADKIKDDALKTIKLLNQIGIKDTVMLTGDHRSVALKVASELKLSKVHYELLPTDKVDIVETLMKNKAKKDKLIFVGDGVNDAPVLARSDIGVAMGALGSDAAIEAADVLIMNDEPSKIADGIAIAKLTTKITLQNIVLALTIKILVLVLSSFGLSSMAEAIFADVGVTILAILNAFRVLNIKSSTLPSKKIDH